MQITNSCFLSKVLTAITLIIRKGLKNLGAGGHCPLKDVPCLQKMHTATKKSIMTRLSLSWSDGFAERLHLDSLKTRTAIIYLYILKHLPNYWRLLSWQELAR